jgi:hypothetical protein
MTGWEIRQALAVILAHDDQVIETGLVWLPPGIRLYASRNLADVAWGQREHLEKGVLWHLDANLYGLLIVDRPTAAEALAWVLQRWNREDAEELAELERAERFRQHAVTGMKISDPEALIAGLPVI